jgi:putrescine transport system permease protein
MTPRPRFDIPVLVIGFAFLYLPMLLLIVFSFNESRLVTVWGGFSTKWYRGLFANGPLMDSLLISLKVAALSALVATVLGTLAAIALTRFGRFRGRMLLGGMVYAPMVMPEIVLGLSLLLLFVGLEMERGALTIMIAHATFTLCFVTVIVQAGLTALDGRLEEAAMDLGCTPFSAFMQVTLPLIAPSIIAGFLLAFTLSLDDLVIASFVSGPGATTLPMRIYSQARLGVTPEINAISTVMIGFVAAGLIVASLALKRRQA